MKLRLITALSILGIFGSFYTQQTNLYSLYNQNNYMLNPAFAGGNSCFNAFIDYRNQWVGVSNSPKTNTLSLDGRLKQKHGIGVDAKMNQAGLLANFNAKLSYAYFVSINAKTELSFGVSAGVIQQQFKAENAIATNYSDALLTQGGNNGVGFTSDLGVALSHERFKIGVAIPQVINQGLSLSYGQKETDFKLKQHIGIYANWSAIQSEKWNIAPFLNYRSAVQVGHQLDAGVHATWNKMIGAGIMYRTSYGIVGMIDLKIKDKLTLAYAYEFGNASITNTSKGSHEVMLGITICREKTKEEPEEESKDVSEVIETSEETKDSVVTAVTEVADTIVIADTKPDEQIITDESYKAKLLDLNSLNKEFSKDNKIIYFEFSSATNALSDNQDKLVKEVVEILKVNPDLIAVVSGYTCDIGEVEFNEKLSRERAVTVGRSITNKGINNERINTMGEGNNDESSSKAKNRKVVIQFLR